MQRTGKVVLHPCDLSTEDKVMGSDVPVQVI